MNISAKNVFQRQSPNSTIQQRNVAPPVYNPFSKGSPSPSSQPAPPVYRPNYVTPQQPMMRHIAAPPVYRPTILAATQLKANPFPTTFSPNVFPGAANARAGVIQPLIIPPSDKYRATGERPAWTGGTEELARVAYNKENPGNPIKKGQSLTATKIDLCHTISYNDMENWVVDYLNGVKSRSRMFAHVKSLFASVDPNSREYRKMASAEMALKQAINDKDKPDQIAKRANELLRWLNSCSTNLGYGSAPLNRGTGSSLDPHMVQTPGGQYQATPNSKRAATDHSPGTVTDYRRTTKGTASSRANAFIRPGEMTPVTKNLFV
jgi:hypothetical protein